jgi:hypothetical protein
MHAKFHKDWLRHSKVDGGDTQKHRQQGDFINLLSIFKYKESRLKCTISTLNNNNNNLSVVVHFLP